MTRRELIALLTGIAAAWPLAVRAQPMPVVGLLLSGSRASSEHVLRAFNQGLAEGGYVEGRNAALEYRWAEDHNERFPQLAAELVQRGVNVIVAVGSPAVAAAKAATTTIPIVFYVGVDPVSFGLVSSLSRPGGNLTGTTNFSLEVGPKRLELLAGLLGPRKVVGLLLNPRRSPIETEIKDLLQAAQALGLQAHLVYAGAEHEFEAVFAGLTRVGADGLAISGDPFFNIREATKHLPSSRTMCSWRPLGPLITCRRKRVRAVQPLRPRCAGESRILARGRPDERGETVLNGNWVPATV